KYIDLCRRRPRTAVARLCQSGQPDVACIDLSKGGSLLAGVVGPGTRGDRPTPSDPVGADRDGVSADITIFRPIRPGEIRQASNTVVSTHIDGNAMRERHRCSCVLRMPNRGGIAVEHGG